MRKLKLDADALRVESFELPRTVDGRGTVRGQAVFTVDSPTCAQYNGCGMTGLIPCEGRETEVNVYSCGESCLNACELTGGMPTCP